MKIVFMGTPEFAVPSLVRLIDDGHTIAAVVTAPPRPRGRGQKVVPTAVEAEAVSRGLKVLAPVALTDRAFVDELQGLSAELFVVVAFRILPPSVYSLPSIGSFNLHASLLPRYRGAAPIAWALVNGEKKTGVTTFLLERKVDTGGILLQESIEVGENETAGDVHDRLSLLGAEVVSKTVRLLGAGSRTPSPQNDSDATPAPKITREDCHIDWTLPARDVHNRVRAFSPSPCAWTTLDGTVFKIFRTTIRQEQSHVAEPGTILSVSGDSCVVAAGSGSVSLVEVMLEGRKRLPIDAFLRGHMLTPGTRLGI